MRGLRAVLALPLLLAAACAPQGTPEHYRAIEAYLLSQGALRADIAPPDAPYDRETLARNFSLVALHTEFPDPEARSNEVRLTKWRDPIVWRIQGGGARESDRAHMRRLSRRLEAATGLPFREAPPLTRPAYPERARLDEDAAPAAARSPAGSERPNLLIYILSASDPRAARTEIEALTPGLTPIFEDWLADRDFLCFAQSYPRVPRGLWSGFAVVGIRDELSTLWRHSCLDEEVAQLLGLPNDDGSVRPSIFNDDEEFAFLTEHDEMLLRILYDPRLRPGMGRDKVEPLVRRILDEMVLPQEARAGD